MASGWISKGTRKFLYKRDSDDTGMPVCCYCGKHCMIGNTREVENPKDYATLDHIVPQKELADAATNDAHFFALRRDPRNLVVVCMGCNSSKKHTPLYVWCKQTGRDYAAILAEIARRIKITR